MSRRLSACLLLLTLWMNGAPRAHAAEALSGPTLRIVRGSLLKASEGVYVLKKRTGSEVRLRLNEDSKVAANLRPGEAVEAYITEENYALIIKPSSKNW